MIQGGTSTWNIRDSHMMETLKRLMEFHDNKNNDNDKHFQNQLFELIIHT